MNINGMTTSLCEVCYRHIPAQRFQRDRAVFIGKTCPEHGYSEHMIESEAIFAETLINDQAARVASGYVVEITDRCNLKCPHCYQMPDNRKIDQTIESIIESISSYPDDGWSITLAGAEPTVRKDLPDLIKQIKLIPVKNPRVVNILTNGVLLERPEYVERLIAAGTDSVTIGLNHKDYQGEDTHSRQLAGIKNCVELGLKIKNINYTIESYNQLPFILQEIQTLKDYADEFRIRGGADIGRAPEDEGGFLSNLIYAVFKLVNEYNYEWDKIPADDNIYHYTVKINGAVVRLIQWASAKNVDLDELQCGPWGSFVPGVPMTNLMHQVILRDAVINKGLTLVDEVPERYIKK